VKTRAVLALSAVLATGISAGAANAVVKKPTIKPVCNLMTDVPGDAVLVGPEGNDDALDILSGDVASDAKTLTAVVRLKAYSSPDPHAPLGQKVYISFNAPGDTNLIYLAASIDPGLGVSYSWGEQTVSAAGTGSYSKVGNATGSIIGNEVHIHVPVADVLAKANVKPGSKLSGVLAETRLLIGAAGGGLVEQVDAAEGTKSYAAGAKSCVTPGK